VINRIRKYHPTPERAAEHLADVAEEEPPLLDRVLEPVRQAIADRPAGALAVSLVLGVAIGWLIKRR
jgi:hypothetical protein